jgi:CRP/FNR family cyclic AMP-dependent transcriptional regulator
MQSRILKGAPHAEIRSRKQVRLMLDLQRSTFNVAAFLASAGLGRRIVQIASKRPFFSQGDPADSVFYLQKGRAKITVVSQTGKEATITMVGAGEFLGEAALFIADAQRLSTATAIIPCIALKIGRDEMIRVMHEEHAFSDMFLKFLLERSMRTQADLVDQLFNSSEKRLARLLLLMAEFGKPDQTLREKEFRPGPLLAPRLAGSLPSEPQDGFSQMIPRISQETLAEMIGTTRSRVSFFMNRFRKLGLIEYSGRIRVHESVLNVILHDNLPGDDAHFAESDGD